MHDVLLSLLVALQPYAINHVYEYNVPQHYEKSTERELPLERGNFKITVRELAGSPYRAIMLV